ncbi:MAG: NADH-quinone oxidoreductase subunit NuoB [Archaeoglobaceae archaeon]|nr:NADH-quinone oxidoreductase subunit NuoB [Archaeoglobaceae archaeon]MCX8151933.1 NADH-quinone oxidoreductase subunit NuoB [Archaeoglobaceae archaeon]MDW8013322.1 NADH-quinone oxidoreductase subunit NuoB [Archaeoglobaceae archaeon]
MEENIKFLRSGILAPIKKWGTHWSLWPVHLVTACCGAELAHAFASGYDGERIGALNYGIARQTNLIIVEGAITRKMARVLRITWEQMPDPKFVIIMGTCGLNGGVFWNSYHLVKPFEVVPVNYFIPGCPSTPEALLRGIRQLQNEIRTGEPRSSIEFEKVDLGKGKMMPVTPKSPKKISLAPSIVVNVPRKADEETKKLADEISKLGLATTVTGKNRIALRVEKDELVDAAKKLQNFGFDHVKNVNVIDVPNEDKFIVEYHLGSYSKRELMPVVLNLFTELPRSEPKLKSLAKIFPSADYMEREMHDFFGVVFEGNEWMGRKFLLAPDTPEYPLKKDFKLEEEKYLR